jgi:hypothetical protein
VPSLGLDGCAFTGPGVDLRGEDADRAIAAAAPIEAWLAAREPGITLRSLSVDLRKMRVLVTLETGERPRVLRFDPPHATELVDLAREAERVIGEACAKRLAARA